MTPSGAVTAASGSRRQRRAAGLPPQERRQAIVDAVIPLLVEHGAGVTTRQIAAAAGVAEGTIFRVFDDKAALLHAAAHRALDPERARAALSAVDPALPLPDMVRRAADLLLERTTEVTAVLVALRGTFTATEHGRRHGPPEFVVEAHRAVLDELTRLFDRYRSELRVEPARAALVLRALAFGCRQPWSDRGSALSSQEIADVLVLGVAVGAAAPASRREG